jgi:hypothetical protein
MGTPITIRKIQILHFLTLPTEEDSTIGFISKRDGKVQVRTLEFPKEARALIGYGELADFWCDHTCKVDYVWIDTPYSELDANELQTLVLYYFSDSKVESLTTFEAWATDAQYTLFLEVANLPYKVWYGVIPYDLALPMPKMTSFKEVSRSGVNLYVEARTKHEAETKFSDITGFYVEAKHAKWAKAICK